MTVDAKVIRAEPHVTIGSVIQRDAGIVLNRWSRRAVEEQPTARRVHHETLLDHLAVLLHELGQSLSASDASENGRHTRPARRHGEQRWESGWSLTEVVRDYQILRLVLLDYLEEVLGRPLASREAMAVGLALDEAIAASVNAYVRESEERSRKADEAMRRQADLLQETNRRKDEFLAVLGHELRNPLAPLRNAVEVLARRGDDRATVDWVRGVLDRQVQHMTRLVEDLLDISRISRGQITLHRERLDLARLVRDTVEDRRSTMADAGLALSLELPPGPAWVDGDPTRLAQVLGNLLHNAIKFTERDGKVTVRMTDDAASRRVCITVRDTGIGIEPAMLSRVFDFFMQIDPGQVRGREGLGLGLALVKGLVELHGGEVRAASEGLGRGAEFAVSLPLAREPGPLVAPPVQPPSSAQSLHILLIEDNRDAAESLKTLLGLFGHRVVVASTGLEGIEAAARETPDVVLCDLSLPGMSGYEVATALRGQPGTARARLIAVSGHGSDADQQRCREVGFDLHLTKPVDPVALQTLLASYSPAR